MAKIDYLSERKPIPNINKTHFILKFQLDFPEKMN